jgi:undecaprenyl-diphosphatase
LPIVQAIVLGLVQGLGEFLPISSSAHLVLVPWMLGWPEHSLQFDVALHMGTLVAITIYFWRDLLTLATEGLTRGTRTTMGRLAWGIVLGSIPAAIFGLALESKVETIFRNPVQIGTLLAVMGVILWYADRRGRKTRTLEDLGIMDIVWTGVAQAFAIIPGFSRSGTTMTAGLLMGMDRETAARVSFLLGWPAIFGAGVLALRHLTAADLTPAFITGVAVSAISGYAVIAFLMDYLKRGTLAVFAIYRVVVAALAFFLYFVRG